ncbi:MAG: hypothetical protein M3Z54_12675 [Gemmatimonadota bacterium]|nr:hypothetical protein [Gemmatimonadota bacterium]
MTETNLGDEGEISLFALGTTLLRNRWRLVRWMLLGAAVALLTVFSKPALYRASASFVPQGLDSGRSGLASLAGQLGVAMPAGTQTLSPDFYANLLKSRELLRRITQDTFVVQERGNRRATFLDLFGIQDGSAKSREEQGIKVLGEIVTASVARTTGVVEFSVVTRWPSVSVAIAAALVDAVNEFNQRMRQAQAAAERKFVEGRLNLAGSDLRAAEDRLESFLKNNRQFASSPDLTFERDRLQRDVTLKQEVFTSLTQSYEEVRIREVRDTPVITVIESPSAPSIPEPRGRIMRVLLGLVVGGLIGMLMVFASETTTRRRKGGDADADEFVGALNKVKGEMLGPVRRLRKTIRR